MKKKRKSNYSLSLSSENRRHKRDSVNLEKDVILVVFTDSCDSSDLLPPGTGMRMFIFMFEFSLLPMQCAKL